MEHDAKNAVFYGSTVSICECFIRDGLQHEEAFVPTVDKIDLINACSDVGFPRIEVTSYSRPETVPAFRDASEVLAGIRRHRGVAYKATCPNARAVRRAIEDLKKGHGADELSLLVSATEAHTERNLRTSRDAQWQNVEEMVRIADGRFTLVGVISVAFGCPFEGMVDPGLVMEDARRFSDLGAKLLTLGDTTGLATPSTVKHLMRRLHTEVPRLTPVAHFHDSRGTGLTNCLAAYEQDCRHFDSSLGGVGGHPMKINYGQGLTGNVATEDLVNLFESLGIATGLDLDLLLAVSKRCEEVLSRPLNSKVAKAGYGLLPGTGGKVD